MFIFQWLLICSIFIYGGICIKWWELQNLHIFASFKTTTLSWGWGFSVCLHLERQHPLYYEWTALHQSNTSFAGLFSFIVDKSTCFGIGKRVLSFIYNLGAIWQRFPIPWHFHKSSRLSHHNHALINVRCQIHVIFQMTRNGKKNLLWCLSASNVSELEMSLLL